MRAEPNTHVIVKVMLERTLPILIKIVKTSLESDHIPATFEKAYERPLFRIKITKQNTDLYHIYTSISRPE